MERRLSAILAADMVGYSRLMEADETATVHMLGIYRQIIDGLVKTHHGRVFGSAGDSVIAEFASPVKAVHCAIEIQQELESRNADLPDDRRMSLRIGINLGDVIVEDANLLGDGVNIAARLESIADPGGICISQIVHMAVGTKLPLDYHDCGLQSVKNIAEPVQAYQVTLSPGLTMPYVDEHVEHATRQSGNLVYALIGISIFAAGSLLWFKPWVSETGAPPVDMAVLPVPEKPSIAVLPFDNLSGDPNQEYFADGITEDLTTDLSKISGLFVVARNSSFSFKGQSMDIRNIAQKLGVRYIVEGSVQRSGDQIRINAQLIDAHSGGHVWADRFDGRMADVFSLQDSVNNQIVDALSINLTANERDQLQRIETTDPAAYDMLLKGIEQYQLFSRETTAEARDLFLKAVDLDPEYARAYANVALTHASDVNFYWTENREESVKLGLEYAMMASELDDDIPQIYLTRSALYLSQRLHSAAIESARRTVEVHPNYSDGHATLAFVLSYSGHLEEALTSIMEAMRIDPKYSYVYLGVKGRILFLMKRYSEAIIVLEESANRNPSFDRTQLHLAASYAMLDRLGEAEWAVEEAILINPELSLDQERSEANYANSEDLEHYIDALGKAGLK